jgi:membrane peptidoglycan carboxypeptidase
MSTAVRRAVLPSLRRRTIVALLALLAPLALLAALAGGYYGSLPGAGDAPARVTRILAAHHGQEVAVPPSARIARAVVAVEDERYFSHGALDPIALGRVAVTTVTGGSDPGGSTIAQQLAKTLYVRGPGTLPGALRAIGMAFKLEHAFTKPQILSMYLNAIYFGHGFYGVQQASRGYFGVPFDRLSWAQAATLAGLPQAPSAYDPFAHPAAARTRRGEVIARLGATHALPPGQLAALRRAPLALRPLM